MSTINKDNHISGVVPKLDSSQDRGKKITYRKRTVFDEAELKIDTFNTTSNNRESSYNISADIQLLSIVNY